MRAAVASREAPELAISSHDAAGRLLASVSSASAVAPRVFSYVYPELHRMAAAIICNIAAANNGSQVQQLCEVGSVQYLVSLFSHWDAQVVQAALAALGMVAATEHGAAVLAATNTSVPRLLALLDGPLGQYLSVSLAAASPSAASSAADAASLASSLTDSPSAHVQVTLSSCPAQGVPEAALALLRAVCRVQGTSFQIQHVSTVHAMLRVLEDKLWGPQQGQKADSNRLIEGGPAAAQSTSYGSVNDAEAVSLMALDTLLLLIHAAVHELTTADEPAAPVPPSAPALSSPRGSHSLRGFSSVVASSEGRASVLDAARSLLKSPAIAQCMPQLLHMLRPGSSSLMVHRAAAILGQLAAEPSRAEQLVACGGVAPLAPLLESPSRSIAAQAASALLRCLPCVQPELLLPVLPSLVRQLRVLRAEDSVSRLLLLRSLRLVDQLVYTAAAACKALHDAGGADALLLVGGAASVLLRYLKCRQVYRTVKCIVL